MGFARLVVVAPRVADFARDAEALAYATHAADVLAAADVCADLSRALVGVQRAFAMSGYAREFGPPLVTVRAAAATAGATVARGGEVAFVFGTERSGLTNEEIERCTDTCAIPADPRCASLNLAQAVQEAAYEAQLALRGGDAVDAALQPFAPEPAAAREQVDAMVDHLMAGLIALGYVNHDDPRRLESRLRRLFNRAQPTATEVDIVRGIAAAMVAPKATRIGRKGGAQS